MERRRDRNPREPSRSFDSPGFLTPTAGVWGPQLEEGAAVFKTTTLSKINRCRFTFQLAIQCRAALQLRAGLALLTAVKTQGFVGSESDC